MTEHLDLREIAFYVMFMVLYFVVPFIVISASYSNRVKFDIRSLWERKGGGALDGLFIIAIGTWWIHSSSMILWTIVQKVQTADYVTYMGWGALVIGKIIADKGFGNGKTNGSQQPGATP